MPRLDQDSCVYAWNFASRVHNNQHLTGTGLPYINHVGSVAMEVLTAIAVGPSVSDPDLAVQCALLHDVIEDTDTEYEELVQHFGEAVASGVLALTKDRRLPDKSEQIRDSLERIRQQPREVWMVKLADRISNLQSPPGHWPLDKISSYLDDAQLIHQQLQQAHDYLAGRLRLKMESYRQYLRG